MKNTIIRVCDCIGYFVVLNLCWILCSIFGFRIPAIFNIDACIIIVPIILTLWSFYTLYIGCVLWGLVGISCVGWGERVGCSANPYLQLLSWRTAVFS